MKRNALHCALAAAFAIASGMSYAQAPAAPAPAPAATPAPAAPPMWKQGMPDSMSKSTLAPHAPKLTETPASDIPLDKLKVPAGFKVELWATGMPGVRMMARGDKGKVYAGTRAIGRVYEITDKDGKRTSRVLIDKLTQPNGVAFRNGSLYVVAIGKAMRFDGIEDNPNAQPVDMTEKLNLGKEQHHQWKFIRFGPDDKLYVPFGAPCNICEPPDGYAQIRRYNPDGTGMEVVARGVRNSVGFDWDPRTKDLWFTDNGRDWAGDAKFDDELNHVTKVGENFGFPYCHSNGTPDPQFKKDKACDGVTKPVASMGEHAAALGMRFYTGSMFPAEYKDAMFIARHGSWNRSKVLGFDVVVAKASADGKKVKVTPFLTGLVNAKDNKFVGRPTDVMQMPDGSLLVSDEQNGAIYRISYAAKAPEAKKKA
jgi:glucose/arabinose dehydrogenase